MSTSTPQTRTKKDRLPFLIAFAAAFALLASLLVGWLTPADSSAALGNGGFCIKAVNDGDPEINGKAGPKNCGEASEPGEEHEQVEAETTFLVERVDTAIQNIELAGRSYHLTVVRHAGGVAETVYEGTKTVNPKGQNGAGYSNNNVVFSDDRDAETDLPFYAPSYTISYDFGSGEIYEVEVEPEHFSKSVSNGGGRQDWSSRTDLTVDGWVRS